MQILKLTIQGFKSFTKEQILDFNKIPVGLTFISGENKVEPSLGGNGVGKSAIWDALTFVFFGKTSTNNKAGELKNWETPTKCKVSVEFEQHNAMYTLERTWNPNTLKLNESTVTQDEVNELIGMNFSSFIYSVFIPQQADKFVDLPPVEKMDLFTSVLDLEKWTLFSEKAKEQVTKINADLSETIRGITATDGEISGIDIASLEEHLLTFEENKQATIKELEKRIVDYLTTDKELNKDLTLKNISIAELEEEGDSIHQFRVKLSDEEDKAKAKLLDITVFLSKLRYQIELAESKEDELKSTKSKPLCHSCLQPINKELLDKEIKNLASESLTLRKTYNESEKEEKILHASIVTIQEEEKLNKSIYDRLQNTLSSLVAERNSLMSEINAIEALKTDCVAYVKAKKAETNPFLSMKEEKEKRLTELNTLLGSLKTKQNSLTKEKALYEYWVKGFKDTKLMLLSEAVKEFEIEINNKLQELGMPDWNIKLAVDTETKSGTVKRGVTILVNSPRNKEMVSFTCWSGGEGQRLRLAITLGLIDFIKGKRGINWNILVFDEPTQFLSEEGIADLIETLKTKADEDSLKIFLIDHRDLHTYGEFKKKIQIVKTEEGSRIWANI